MVSVCFKLNLQYSVLIIIFFLPRLNLGLTNPCAAVLCETGSVCIVFRGEAICTSPERADRLVCAGVNLRCPDPDFVCRAVNGQAECVPNTIG